MRFITFRYAALDSLFTKRFSPFELTVTRAYDELGWPPLRPGSETADMKGICRDSAGPQAVERAVARIAIDHSS